MKDNQAKYPQLRFKGFTDPWEQRKLGELSQKISVGIATSSSKHFSSQDQGVPFIKNQDIKENRINTKNLEYISKEFDNKNKNKRVKQGDIITARTGYPGLSAVVPKELEGAQTFTTLITRPISEMILSEYISIFINSPYGMKQISGMEAGGAQKNVNAGIVQNLLIPLPSLDEQKKISNFILKLDDTIALHQRKLAKLKELKQGYLQKMFPKNGSKFPQLRFAGFADDWEERKLTDLATTYIGLVTTMTENYTTEGTLLIRNSDIKEGRFDLSNPIYLEEQFAEKNKTRRMKKGDVVTVHTGDIGTSAIINSELDGTIGFATITTRPKKELDSNFLAWYFNSNYHKKYAKRMSTGDGRSNYNMKDFNKNVIPTPKIAEQQKIGSFFKQLDDTIALHQRKLDLLKEQKKGFLQKMFC